jgi:hypothetical protein
LCVDEGHSPVEVFVAEERSLKRQQLFASDPKVGVPRKRPVKAVLI